MRHIDRDLTEGKLTRNIWHLALPLMVTSALQDLFNIVDMIFVGRLGPAAIAAVSVSGILMGVVRMVAIGISTGPVALVSRFIGQKNLEAAGTVMFHSVILSLSSYSSFGPGYELRVSLSDLWSSPTAPSARPWKIKALEVAPGSRCPLLRSPRFLARPKRAMWSPKRARRL